MVRNQPVLRAPPSLGKVPPPSPMVLCGPQSEGFGFPCESCSRTSPCCLPQSPGQLILLIEETTSTECRQDVATTLLKLFLGQGLAKDFLDLLFQLELGRTSEAWEGVARLRAWWGTRAQDSGDAGRRETSKSSCRRLMGPIKEGEGSD